MKCLNCKRAITGSPIRVSRATYHTRRATPDPQKVRQQTFCSQTCYERRSTYESRCLHRFDRYPKDEGGKSSGSSGSSSDTEDEEEDGSASTHSSG